MSPRSTSPRLRSDEPVSDERGSAVVVVALALVGLVVCVAGVVLLIGVAAVGHARASSAADLAALAGADRLAAGRAGACAHAARVARHNRARLVSCVVTADSCTVVVEMPYTGPLHRLGAARGEARAGSHPVT